MTSFVHVLLYFFLGSLGISHVLRISQYNNVVCTKLARSQCDVCSIQCCHLVNEPAITCICLISGHERLNIWCHYLSHNVISHQWHTPVVGGSISNVLHSWTVTCNTNTTLAMSSTVYPILRIIFIPGCILLKELTLGIFPKSVDSEASINAV